MARLNREKTSDAVVSHILGLLFEGELRSHDRLDLTQLAESLGVSTVPVREALLVLERDGVVVTHYHRGYFVAPFDATTIRDHFDLYGELAGAAVRKAVTTMDDATLRVIGEKVRELDRMSSTGDLERASQQILWLVNHAGASVRLKALLRSFDAFVPASLRIVPDHLAVKTFGRGFREVFRAIQARDPKRAEQATIDHCIAWGEVVVSVLQDRGTLPPLSAGMSANVDVDVPAPVKRAPRANGRNIQPSVPR